jgi:hypothetical protein
MSAVMATASGLALPDRSAFLAAVATRLRFEPEPGDGTVGRILRELQASGHYRRATTLAVGARAPRGYAKRENGA